MNHVNTSNNYLKYISSCKIQSGAKQYYNYTNDLQATHHFSVCLSG